MTTPQVTKDTTKTPIFAYLRRSTKNKQEISLEIQSDNIDWIIKDNGLNKDEVQYFMESRSAYEGVKQKNGVIVRKRTEFTALLKAIDASKSRCIILVRDSSRLSRNKLDNLEITKRLFGEYGHKRSIEKIIFYGRKIWDEKGDKISIDNELLQNYHESITTGKRSRDGTEGQIRRKYYIYATPP